MSFSKHRGLPFFYIHSYHDHLVLVTEIVDGQVYLGSTHPNSNRCYDFDGLRFILQRGIAHRQWCCDAIVCISEDAATSSYLTERLCGLECGFFAPVEPHIPIDWEVEPRGSTATGILDTSGMLSFAHTQATSQLSSIAARSYCHCHNEVVLSSTIIRAVSGP